MEVDHVAGTVLEPRGLYTQLWEHRELPIALVDDVDHLFRTKGAVSLLKCLCQTEKTKTISWVSGMTNRGSCAPAHFKTSMRLTVLANDLSPLEANLTALLDRAYVLEFRPSNEEIHRQVGTWFGHSDHERPIYQFIGENLPLIPALSMRDYAKARELSELGMDWRDYLQAQWLDDPKLALVARLLADPTLPTTTDRVRQFMAGGGGCRRTYINFQAQLRHLRGEP